MGERVSDRFNTAQTPETKDEWLTPPEIIRALGDFDLDPCAPRKEIRPWPMAAKHFTGAPDLFSDWNDEEAFDGLNTPWQGRVWLNPPYGDETFLWMQRLAEHKSGIALIFARTDTIGFHEQVFTRALALFFMRGRISFYHVTGIQGDKPNAGSVLVAYSEEDADVLCKCDLAGYFLRMGN